jgi:uncharacterized protein (TIGR03435 family)
MKRLILWVAALVVLQGGALLGQSLVGTWQGPLQVSQTPGDTLRVVFKISTTSSGTLYGDMYSIDQGGQTGAPDVTLKGFAGFLQRGVLDRPVLDQTGLNGRFDFGLLWRPEALPSGPGNNPPPPSDSDGLPDIYTAIQQQLGLRLEATKTPTEVIVIDHLQKPSEN